MKYQKPSDLAKHMGIVQKLTDTSFCDCCGLQRWFCDSLINNPWKYSNDRKPDDEGTS